MKHNLNWLCTLAASAFLLAGCNTSRTTSTQGERNSGTSGTSSSLTSTESTHGGSSTSSVCGQLIVDLWIEGRVDLVADETSTGLIAVSKTDVFWIPYFRSNDALELHDVVFFKLQSECVNNMADTITIATQVTTARPTAGICSGNCLADEWLMGRSVMPHGLYEHAGGGTMHKPGHVISLTTTTKFLKVMDGTTLLQTEEYKQVRVRYKTTLEEEVVYIPTKFVDELSQSTVDYYLEYYDTRIDGLQVLRSFSADHTHPGHVTNITITQ